MRYVWRNKKNTTGDHSEIASRSALTYIHSRQENIKSCRIYLFIFNNNIQHHVMMMMISSFFPLCTPDDE